MCSVFFMEKSNIVSVEAPFVLVFNVDKVLSEIEVNDTLSSSLPSVKACYNTQEDQLVVSFTLIISSLFSLKFSL